MSITTNRGRAVYFQTALIMTVSLFQTLLSKDCRTSLRRPKVVWRRTSNGVRVFLCVFIFEVYETDMPSFKETGQKLQIYARTAGGQSPNGTEDTLDNPQNVLNTL